MPSSVDISLDIDTIFVPLALERAGRQEGYDHGNILEVGNRIRIIGDPGSGKSSIAKRIFRDACKNGIAHPRKARLPILVELRRLNFPKAGKKENLGGWLLEYLRTDTVNNSAYDLGSCFDIYALTTGLLIILDGLDEISTASYPRAEAAISGLSEKLSRLGLNNILILTMRTQFHYQIKSAYSSSFPVVMSLKPFSPTDIYEFLRRWDFDSAKKDENIIRIYTDLTDQPTLREMCANPLVLSMYVARDQAAGHPLAPESRSDFYSRVTEELLIKRRAVQVGASVGQTVLRQQRQKILGIIAFDHLLDADEPANLLSWAKGVSVVEKVMAYDHDAAEIYLRLISRETGLITEEREGEAFRFIHLTFCEFLAAFEAAQGRSDGWSQLINCHRSFSEPSSTSALGTRLLEVLPFAAALMPLHMRAAAIQNSRQSRTNGRWPWRFLKQNYTIIQHGRRLFLIERKHFSITQTKPGI